MKIEGRGRISQHAGYAFSLAAWVGRQPALLPDMADQEHFGAADLPPGSLLAFLIFKGLPLRRRWTSQPDEPYR